MFKAIQNFEKSFRIIVAVWLLCWPIHAANNILGVLIDLNTFEIIDTLEGGSFTGVLGTPEDIGSISYYGGSFDEVEFYDSDTLEFVGQLSPCNNIFRINNSTGLGSVLAYSGGNGVNGPVNVMKASTTGDLYVGGQFTQAGPNPYSKNLGVWLSTGAWNNSSILSLSGSGTTFVDVLSWNLDGSLRVEGQYTSLYLQHPGESAQIINPVANNNLNLQDSDLGFLNIFFTD